jgi:hypothetical protein
MVIKTSAPYLGESELADLFFWCVEEPCTLLEDIVAQFVSWKVLKISACVQMPNGRYLALLTVFSGWNREANRALFHGFFRERAQIKVDNKICTLHCDQDTERFSGFKS